MWRFFVFLAASPPSGCPAGVQHDSTRTPPPPDVCRIRLLAALLRGNRRCPSPGWRNPHAPLNCGVVMTAQEVGFSRLGAGAGAGVGCSGGGGGWEWMDPRPLSGLAQTITMRMPLLLALPRLTSFAQTCTCTVHATLKGWQLSVQVSFRWFLLPVGTAQVPVLSTYIVPGEVPSKHDIYLPDLPKARHLPWRALQDPGSLRTRPSSRLPESPQQPWKSTTSGVIR